MGIAPLFHSISTKKLPSHCARGAGLFPVHYFFFNAKPSNARAIIPSAELQPPPGEPVPELPPSTLTVNSLDALANELYAYTVNVYSPPSVSVPERTPFVSPSVRPSGRLPALTRHESPEPFVLRV